MGHGKLYNRCDNITGVESCHYQADGDDDEGDEHAQRRLINRFWIDDYPLHHRDVP